MTIDWMAQEATYYMHTFRRQPIVVERGEGDVRCDLVAVEEPLEIRVDGEPLVITMRSPGAEVELALGYLYAEGWIEDAADVDEVAAGAATRSDGQPAVPADEPTLVPGSIGSSL